MLIALSSAVSGLMDQQTRMDIIGNNVANVDTVAFKSGSVTFKEGFAQLMQSATGPSQTTGGTNPVQIGLGSAIGSINTDFSQGNLQSTGNNTDLAIQGDSFFIMKKGDENFYTRAGNFQTDANGDLVSATDGYAVQGRMAVNGKLSNNITNLQIPLGQTSPANATTTVTLSGNLDASAPVFDPGTASTVNALDPTQRALPQNAGAYQDMSISVYDSLGNTQQLKVTMWKTGANTWDWTVDPSNLNISSAGVTTTGTHPITFNPDGTIDTSNGFTAPEIQFTPTDGASPVDLKLDLGSGSTGLTQFAGSANAVMANQDGYAAGTMQSFTIDNTGTIIGSFTNGTTQTLGQVALADFNNPSGLERTGDNMYSTTANSGAAVVGYAGDGNTSTIASGNLEMSNVDLAQQFTDMIVAQRGFQANSKVITTTDQMLQDLVNLKQ